MKKKSNKFTNRRIMVSNPTYGVFGVITAVFFHYPCWIGNINPTENFLSRMAEIREALEYSDLNVELCDLETQEKWYGSLSDLRMPEEGYSWIEVKWCDEKHPE